MNLPIELLLAISLAGQQISENLLSTLLTGPLMKLAAIGVSVGLTFGAWTMGIEGLARFSVEQVAVLGVFAGLGSNVMHAILARIAPSNTATPFVGVLANLRKNRTPRPPAPGV